MKVESIVLGSIGTNCYIVTNEETKECFAVDMADCPQEFVKHIFYVRTEIRIPRSKAGERRPGDRMRRD